jgi:hypothetical protein
VGVSCARLSCVLFVRADASELGSYRRASKGGRASESSGAPQSKGEWDRWDNKGGWGDEGTSTTGNDAGGNTSGVAGSAKGGGSSIGRMRAYSNSSKAESVAPGTGDGWDDVSNGPW